MPTITLSTLYVFVFISHGRRRIEHTNVTSHPSAEWVWRQVLEATPWGKGPRFLIRDRDKTYGGSFIARAKRIGIKDVYVIGGNDLDIGLGGPDHRTNGMERATFLPDGTLSPWESQLSPWPDEPAGRRSGAGIVPVGGRIYVAGGTGLNAAGAGLPPTDEGFLSTTGLFDTDFYCEPQNPLSNQTVTCTDLSFDVSSPAGSVDSWNWDFGDGHTASSTPVVTHTYATAGPHTVTLTTGGTHPGTEVKVDYIERFEAYGDAHAKSFTDFAVTSRAGIAPFSTQFLTQANDNTSSTATIITWSWDFGDGETLFVSCPCDPIFQNPLHTYDEPGFYTASLTTTGTHMGTETKVDYIVVVSTAQTDTTPPVVTSTVAGTVGNNGWYVSDITVEWTVSDEESAVTIVDGCGTGSFDSEGVWHGVDVIDSDTAGVTLTCSASSDGGADSKTVGPLMRDATEPVVTISSPLDFAVKPVGLEVTFVANDVLSGVESVAATLDDGSGPVPIVSGHVISTPGIYTLSVDATDNADNASSESRMFVVYDPAGGFATGGGWIIPGGNNSDPGDLLPGIDGSSKATFGFVVKYKNGASTAPVGSLEFQYQVGQFNLHSADYEWLIVTNSNWAKFQGSATINGSTDIYPFRVDARDGSNGQADRFIIKIWAPGTNPDVDELIYKASGGLGGGKVKIHQ